MDADYIWYKPIIKLASESINYQQLVGEFIILLSILFVFKIHQTLTNTTVQLPIVFL